MTGAMVRRTKSTPSLVHRATTCRLLFCGIRMGFSKPRFRCSVPRNDSVERKMRILAPRRPASFRNRSRMSPHEVAAAEADCPRPPDIHYVLVRFDSADGLSAPSSQSLAPVGIARWINGRNCTAKLGLRLLVLQFFSSSATIWALPLIVCVYALLRIFGAPLFVSLSSSIFWLFAPRTMKHSRDLEAPRFRNGWR